MSTEEKTFREFLRSKHLRFTPERNAILKTVSSLRRHFGIDDIYDKLRERGNNISRSSIYRTLPLLEQCGLITQTFRCLDRVTYEHSFGHIHHDHMLCIKCGKVIEFRNEKIEKLQEQVCEQFGFKAIEHRLGIKGYCKNCRRR